MEISTLDDALGAFLLEDDTLFGVRFIPESTELIPDDLTISVQALGMFDLKPGSAAFRVRYSITVPVFKELWVDVAAIYSAPEEYRIEKTAMLAFANSVAAPHIRRYAQSVLDPLMAGAHLPAGIIPSPQEMEGEIFQGSRLDDFLGPETMEDLRERADLAIPTIEPYEEA